MKGTGGTFYTIPGLVAGEDLSNSIYKVVQLSSTAGEVKLASSATDPLVGILLDNPEEEQPALIAYSGVVRAIAESSFSAGAKLTASSTGRVKATTTEGDVCIGVALEAATTIEYVSVLLKHFEVGA